MNTQDQEEFALRRKPGNKRCAECGLRVRGAGHFDGPHHKAKVAEKKARQAKGE
jgi:hypothetical protein